MKQISIILCIWLTAVFTGASPAWAATTSPRGVLSSETYCYKQVSVVDRNGAKSKGNGKLMYITFINQYGKCYESDREGNDLQYNSTYQLSLGLMIFRKTNGQGLHIYDTVLKSWPRQVNYFSGDVRSAFQAGCVQGETLKGGFVTYYFSGDFSRLNSRRELDGSYSDTTVWQRIDESRESEDIDFY